MGRGGQGFQEDQGLRKVDVSQELWTPNFQVQDSHFPGAHPNTHINNMPSATNSSVPSLLLGLSDSISTLSSPILWSKPNGDDNLL